MKIKYIVLYTLLLFSTQIFALDLQLGVSAANRYITAYQKVNGQRGSEIVALHGDISWTPDIGLSGDQHSLDESNFGYYYFGGYAQGKADTVVSTGQKIPTPISTSIVYGGGTIYYILGDKNITSGQHILGVGLGLGYINANGTVPAAFTKTGTTENINLATTGLAVDVFYRYVTNGWYFYAGAKGVAGSDNGTREYQTNATLISIGKIFNIDGLWGTL